MNRNCETKIYLADINRVNESHIGLISPERAEKAARYKMAGDKKRCIAAGVLLSRFLPGAEIYTDSFGKPRSKSGECFNLSHSGDYAVLAVSGCETGVDIEVFKEVNALRMGKIVYCQNEMTMLENSQDRLKLFFDFWTKKEALLKCMGKGFHRNAKSVDVSGDCFEENGKRYYFKTYRFSGYTLSVCSEKNSFPDNLEFIEI